MHRSTEGERLERVDELLRVAAAFDRRAPACGPVRLSISAGLDGELSELGWRRIEAHVACCRFCRAFLEDVWAMSTELAAATIRR
jgi:hypothetical protein